MEFNQNIEFKIKPYSFPIKPLGFSSNPWNLSQKPRIYHLNHGVFRQPCEFITKTTYISSGVLNSNLGIYHKTTHLSPEQCCSFKPRNFITKTTDISSEPWSCSSKPGNLSPKSWNYSLNHKVVPPNLGIYPKTTDLRSKP